MACGSEGVASLGVVLALVVFGTAQGVAAVPASELGLFTGWAAGVAVAQACWMDASACCGSSSWASQGVAGRSLLGWLLGSLARALEGLLSGLVWAGSGC